MATKKQFEGLSDEQVFSDLSLLLEEAKSRQLRLPQATGMVVTYEELDPFPPRKNLPIPEQLEEPGFSRI
jgi:hypothetical protein